nr:hypothetical protein [Pseudomonas coleopterorum]
MTKAFDMEVFLAGVLTGSLATRQRHLGQTRFIHAAIAERWHVHTPWCWKQKHLGWFLKKRLAERRNDTRYYYLLTAELIARRLGASWVLSL